MQPCGHNVAVTKLPRLFVAQEYFSIQVLGHIHRVKSIKDLFLVPFVVLVLVAIPLIIL